MKNFKEWFAEHNDSIIWGKYGEDNITIEDLYQNFKARMEAERLEHIRKTLTEPTVLDQLKDSTDEYAR